MSAGRLRLTGNLPVLAAMFSLRGVHTSVFNVIWQPFVLGLGASMPVLGLLNSIGGSVGLVPTLAQSLGGWFADRVGRKPFVIGSSLATLLAYGLFGLAGALGLWALLAIGVIVYGLSAIARPAFSSLTAESVRAEHQGSAYSVLVVAQTIPGIVMPALGGWAAGAIGFGAFFIAGIVVEAAVLALGWHLLNETVTSPARVKWRDAVAALRRSVTPPRHLMGFALASAADMTAWGMGYGLLFGMLTETYHFSTTELGLMAAVMSLTWAVVQLPLGRYIDRHRTLPMMIFSEALGLPLMVIWMTQSRFEILAASQIIMGVTAATWVPAASTYLARHTAVHERAESFGRLNAFRGLLGFPAPALGGLLYQWGGLAAPLTANLVGILLIIAILAKFTPERWIGGTPLLSTIEETGG